MDAPGRAGLRREVIDILVWSGATGPTTLCGERAIGSSAPDRVQVLWAEPIAALWLARGESSRGGTAVAKA